MRILIDECVPRRLKAFLTEHHCSTVAEMSWRGKKNGDLLASAEGKFDVLLTADRGYEHQQNLANRNISVIILSGRSNTFDSLRHLMVRCRECLDAISPGQVIVLH